MPIWVVKWWIFAKAFRERAELSTGGACRKWQRVICTMYIEWMECLWKLIKKVRLNSWCAFGPLPYHQSDTHIEWLEMWKKLRTQYRVSCCYLPMTNSSIQIVNKNINLVSFLAWPQHGIAMRNGHNKKKRIERKWNHRWQTRAELQAMQSKHWY